MAGHKKWSTEDDANLVSWYNQGADHHAIARRLDRTTAAVQSRLTLMREQDRITAPRRGKRWGEVPDGPLPRNKMPEAEFKPMNFRGRLFTQIDGKTWKAVRAKP